MVKWLMTGPFSQLKQKSSGDCRRRSRNRRRRRGRRRGLGITYSETKVLEQFPKDKLELRKMIDK